MANREGWAHEHYTTIKRVRWLGAEHGLERALEGKDPALAALVDLEIIGAIRDEPVRQTL